MGSILKRIFVAFLIIIGMLAALGIVYIGLEYIGFEKGDLGIFSQIAMLLAVMFAIVSLFNERVRNIAGGALVFLFGLPFGLAPLIYIYFKITGRPVGDLEEYTFVSQLLIACFFAPMIGLGIMMWGAGMFRKARNGQESATP